MHINMLLSGYITCFVFMFRFSKTHFDFIYATPMLKKRRFIIQCQDF